MANVIKRVICFVAIVGLSIVAATWRGCDPCTCRGNRMTCRGPGALERSIPYAVGLADVEYLTLLNDKALTTLDARILKNFTKLKRLKIEKSALKTISKGALEVAAIEKLHVPNNAIKSISWKALSNSANRLKELDISGNPIDCENCNNLWLANIDYRYSKLLTVPYANGSKSLINCLSGCPNDIALNNIFSLPERIKFKRSRKCSTLLTRSCAAPTLKVTMENITDGNNHNMLHITCRISSKRSKYLDGTKLFYAYDDTISNDAAIKWHQTLNTTLTYSVKRTKLASSGWFLCVASTKLTPLLATLPVTIYGRPKVLLEKLTKAERRSGLQTLYIRFHLLGLPRPDFNLTSLHPGSHHPSVIYEPIDTLHFYALQGEVVFRHHSSWKFLCLGSYKMSACNSYGCDEDKFSLLGYPGSCSETSHIAYSNGNANGTNATEIGSSTKLAHGFGPLAETAFIVGGVIAGALAISIGYLCMKFRRRTNHRKRVMQSPNRADVTLIAEDEMCLLAAQNQLYFTWLHDLAQRTDIPVFNENCVSVVRQLGEGAFGCVLLVDVYNTGESVSMAMKVIKPNVQDRLCDLEQEAKILSGLKHPNIVKFHGLSQHNGRSALLFEYMEGGDLVNYIRDRKPSPEEGQTALCLKELTDISLQIATGMEYLHRHRLVHRDLAARNCLVGAGLTIKISDFGMTRDVYVTDYYKMDSRTLVPLRWLPPESILYRRFTTESDVWSFGVVMWEIFSYGQVPWCMFSNHEVLEQVTTGNILGRPADCPSHIYDLMKRCWDQEPLNRVNMSTLRMEFMELNSTLSEATCTTKL